RRELTHEHIENCAACTAEWVAYKETWSVLDELPDVDVPARAKARFLAQVMPDSVAIRPADNVVPFHRRGSVKWLAQAAAIVAIASGSWYVGHRSQKVEIIPQEARVMDFTPTPMSIAETRFLPASSINPNIEGRPDIQNVQFTDGDPSDGKIAMSFDIKSRWTVEGSPSDRSMVKLLSYVIEKEDSMSASRSGAIDWVRKTYSDPAYADPEIANALGKVLRNDEHQGVRIRAIDTLKTLPAAVTSQTREALIEALKSDPNPAVRIKAVEALANMARSGTPLDATAVDTLRQTASQENENLYVRVKAAEALSNIQ
ncbi:MAG TPA: HEAT repeat domain-containing protein, partial [Thermoanaerobaculia bacterium]|nr:HEAT repeat domain-containing protein [Thermoanaerobaculia bacterium]